jgi:DNA polymerase (family 10)
MGCLRAILCLIFPPLAVIDKGCGSILIVAVLTLLGWIPGVLAALIILQRATMTNQELARHLRDLTAYLTIAGYDELHARRYLHIAHEVEAMGEPVEELRKEGRLQELPGVGPAVAGYLKEILETGKSSKQSEWEATVPFSVVELVRIPNLGAKTAQRLLHEHGVYSLDSLKVAIDTGRLATARGIGDRTLRTWREAIDRIQAK